MKVLYYKSPRGNFGDDLNPLIWREVLSPACFDVEDVVLLGIGSIFRDDYLSPPATAGKRVFVLGSGAGTGPLPSLWPNDKWSILAVRGPLTGRLIGMPDKAITDSAALLATIPALPGCIGDGETEMEAIADVRLAALEWAHAATVDGDPIPAPPRTSPMAAE